MAPLSFKTPVGFGSLLIWTIMLQVHFSFSDGCLLDERSSLLDFKAGLNLSSGRLSSWRGLNCCEWEGVVCDYHTSHVITLYLSNPYYVKAYQLSGKLRPSLFNLQHLQHLDLGGNSFKGASISPELSKLQRLTFLDLSDSEFCGEVPLELENMSSLRHLDLSDNYWDFKTSNNQWLELCKLKSSKFDVWVRNLRSLEFLQMNRVNLSMASEKWGEALNSLPNLTQIHFYWCGLSGNIPDLSNLTRLSHLQMGSNSLSLGQSFWFENVSSLVSLDLSSCGLNGVIPSNFMPHSKMSNLVLYDNPNLKGDLSSFLSHSSSLVSLSIASCDFGRVISPVIANFSKLETLDLRWNSFRGGIPSNFESLSALTNLDLSHNKLTANISLQIFDGLSQLKELDLSDNQFAISISPSWVPRFSHLRHLGLGSCGREGEFPGFLSQQYDLEELNLSGNNMVGNLPSWLWNLPFLKMLNLSKNQLEGTLPCQLSRKFVIVDLHENKLFGSLPAIDFVSHALDLSNNGFNGSIPEINSRFRFLSLSENNLSGEIPGFVNCTDQDGFTNTLEILILSKNKLRGRIPANIGSCSNLKVLNLAQNVLQWEVPEELGNLKALRTLNLNSNSLQGSIPLSIANCINLRVLDMGNNIFEGSIPIWIEKLIELRVLNLASNKFKGVIPSQVFRLQNLQILDLSGNTLSGNIPPGMGKLCAMVNQSQSDDVQQTEGNLFYTAEGFDHVLQYVDDVTIWIKGMNRTYKKIIASAKFMDLSHNNLSGNIPQQFGLLTGLISLNISKNNLSGSIPKSLQGMLHLESLDLSQNKLSGKIPSELLSLTFLAVLNLSNNMLSGLIPQGKQFLTFEASSFLGNPHLYGPQLENWTKNHVLGSQENHKELNNATTSIELDRWWAVGVGLSYGVGFAIVIAVLCFHIRWRSISFAQMDSLIYHLFES